MSAQHRFAFQDYYPDDVAHCYGCGRLNEQGHQMKSYWDGEETVASFVPGQQHTAIPGYVYGGLIASLIDCHSTGTASAAAARLAGWDPAVDPEPPELPRFVTASLKIDYLRPTPLGPPLELRSTVTEARPKKIVVETALAAAGQVTARGTVVAVRMPESMQG